MSCRRFLLISLGSAHEFGFPLSQIRGLQNLFQVWFNGEREWGQQDAGATLKKRASDALFKSFDRVGQGRLRNSALLSCFAEMLLIAESEKIVDVLQFH